VEIVTRSTYDSFSNVSIVETLQEGLSVHRECSVLDCSLFVAPRRPSDTEINEKIVLGENHPLTNSEEYLVQIDRTLFNDDYGPIRNYSIYLRQGPLVSL
jgi:hypothetical protein